MDGIGILRFPCILFLGLALGRGLSAIWRRLGVGIFGLACIVLGSLEIGIGFMSFLYLISSFLQ